MTWDNIQYFEKAFLVCYDIIVLKRGFQLIRYVRLTYILTGALALKLDHKKCRNFACYEIKAGFGGKTFITPKKVHCFFFFYFLKRIFSSSFRRNPFFPLFSRRNFWSSWRGGSFLWDLDDLSDFQVDVHTRNAMIHYGQPSRILFFVEVFG